MTSMRTSMHPASPGSVRRWLMVLTALALLLTGCTAEDRDSIRDAVESARPTGGATEVTAETEAAAATEPVPTEAPAPTEASATEAPTEASATEAPATEAPATEAPTEEPVVTEEDARDWLPWILAALAALLVLGFVVSAMRRASDRRRAGRAALSGRLGTLVGTGRWLHDQGIPEIQRSNDPVQLQQFWQTTRQHMVAMEEEVAAMLLDAEGDPLANALKQLDQASTTLRSAVDGDVALRREPGAHSELLDEGRRNITDRRREFNAALDRVASFR